MLVADGLAAIRGDAVVLRGISFSVTPGAAMVVTGANGAGKSTLLRLLAGLRPPDAGTLRWQGSDIQHDLPGYARDIAYLGHLDAVKPGLSVLENLALLPARPGSARCVDALGRLNLAGLRDLPARMLSAGQKRRLALARVLVGQARLWLLDEPATALDTASLALLGDMLAAHRAAGGMVVAATHGGLPLPGAAELVL